MNLLEPYYKRILLSMTAVLSCLLVQGQATVDNSSYRNAAYGTIRTNSPTSPQMQLFQRYGDLPVNYSTGVPNISVPLGELKLKDFTWPISVSYHAGGIRVGDVASNVGLGWVLNAGGFITSKGFYGSIDRDDEFKRLLDLNSARDKPTAYPDEDNTLYENYRDIILARDFANLAAYHMCYLYYLNMPVLNSKFYLQDDAVDHKTKGYTIPISNNRIESTNSGLLITDTKGNVFEFTLGGNVMNTNTNSNSSTIPNSIIALTKITTYQGETISFTYYKKSYGYYTASTEIFQTGAQNDCLRCRQEAQLQAGGTQNQSSGDDFYLSEINTSNNQRVVFNYSGRNDLSGAEKLDKVTFSELSPGGGSNITSTYDLSYTYFGSSSQNNLRLRLDKVSNTTVAGKPQAYNFEYDSEVLPDRLSKGIDAMGYYNGATGNTTLIPSKSNRSFSLQYTKAASLSKMSYPTGGFTTFNYELNQGDWGGLRIQSMTDYTAANVIAKQRSYTYYGGNSNQLNFINYDHWFFFGNDPHGYVIQDPIAQSLFTCTVLTEQSIPVVDELSSWMESPMTYGIVGENVDDFVQGSVASGGKTIYRYNSLINYNDRVYTYPFSPLLTEKEVFKKSGSDYVPVFKEETYYSLPEDDLHEGPNYWLGTRHKRERSTWIKRFDLFRDHMALYVRDGNGYGLGYYRHWGKEYLQRDWRFDIPVVFMDKQVVHDFRSGQDVKTETQYNYDKAGTEIEPQSILTTSSSGEALKQEIKYSNSDLSGIYGAGDTAAIAGLVRANLIQPIWKRSSRNAKVTSEGQVYFVTQNNIALPVKEQLRIGTSDAGSMQITRYDSRSNPLEMLSNDRLYSATRYSGRNEKTAECSPCRLDELAYASFDNGGETGFTFPANPALVGAAYAGKYGYDLAGGELKKSGLTVGSAYLITMYGQAASPAISGGAVTLLRSTAVKGGWQLYQYKVVPTASTVQISGSGIIDELRLRPLGAQLKTYVYNDLYQQLNASTDASGRTTYYEYDAFQRLVNVKDQDGKVLKHYDYHYQNQ